MVFPVANAELPHIDWRAGGGGSLIQIKATAFSTNRMAPTLFTLSRRHRAAMKPQTGKHFMRPKGPVNGDRSLQLCRTQGERPAKVIGRAHDDVLKLCQQLEEIADSLPTLVDRGVCSDVSVRIAPLIADVHRYEETILFPWLEQHYPQKPVLHESLQRLRAEHVEVEGFADEISGALQNIALGRSYQAETVGYMLWGFFEGVRRHVACEREYLYVLLDA
jgi:hemerythrin-like domain-containing protein